MSRLKDQLKKTESKISEKIKSAKLPLEKEIKSLNTTEYYNDVDYYRSEGAEQALEDILDRLK